MKLYITENNESFEQTKARYEKSTQEYKGHTIRKNWNGYDVEGIVLGFMFNTAAQAMKFIDAKIEKSSVVVNNEWPELR